MFNFKNLFNNKQSKNNECDKDKKNLYKKMFAVQHNVEDLIKTNTNDEYGSKYVPLNQVLDKLYKETKKQNLLILQPFTYIEDRKVGVRPALETTIMDLDTDMYFKSTAPLPRKSDPQKICAAVTYYRRYSLLAVFGLKDQSDDDGNLAAGKSDKPDKKNAKELKTINDLKNNNNK